MQIIDLTMPIEDHFRWPVERKLTSDFAAGDDFQVTWMGWAVHGFTHIDAPRHMLPNGATTTDLHTHLEKVVGRTAVVDLSHVEPNMPITAEMMASAGAHIEPNGIVLLRTCWDVVVSPSTPEFWTTAPYMTREAAQWLLDRQIQTVGFDFPQDYPIRLLLKNERPKMSEMVTHDVLLRNGVTLIEYLCNLQELTTPFAQLVALPLKIMDADGAPARVIATKLQTR